MRLRNRDLDEEWVEVDEQEGPRGRVVAGSGLALVIGGLAVGAVVVIWLLVVGLESDGSGEGADPGRLAESCACTRTAGVAGSLPWVADGTVVEVRTIIDEDGLLRVTVRAETDTPAEAVDRLAANLTDAGHRVVEVVDDARGELESFLAVADGWELAVAAPVVAPPAVTFEVAVPPGGDADDAGVTALEEIALVLGDDARPPPSPASSNGSAD